MLRKIYLYGGLSENFTSEAIELSAENAPDLLLALKSIFPGWRAYTNENPDMIFVLSNDNKEDMQAIEPELIQMSFGDFTEVHILPVQDGKLMAITAFAAWAATNAVAALVISTLFSMAMSVAVSAIMQALAPTPSTSSGSRNQVAQNQSFLYNGPTNVQEQGGAVPVIYGVFMAGSVVVSSEIDTVEIGTSAPAPTPANSVLIFPLGQKPAVPAQPWQWLGVNEAKPVSIWKAL